jgi:hypothetical protein
VCACNNPRYGFLFPGKEALPAGYTVFSNTLNSAGYGVQFDKWVKAPLNGKPYFKRIAQIIISEHNETPKINYDSIVGFHGRQSESEKIKDFTFEGSDGVLFKNIYRNQPHREGYELFWRDGNRILQISVSLEEKDPGFSGDDLIRMLGKFKRV